MKMTVKYVGPKLAEALLSSNSHNRSVSYHRVQTLANEMRSGKWQLNGETIVISDSGKLLDGQHRLYAILESGCTVQLAIAEGVPENSFETIDTGRARTAGEIAGMAGIGEGTIVSAAAGLIWRMYHGASVNETCPAYISLRVIERYPALTKWAHKVVQARPRVLSPASFLAAIVYLEDVAQKPALAERFYKSILTGAGLEELDPCLTLRNRMLSIRGGEGPGAAGTQRLNSYVTWGAVARTLSALEAGDRLKRLFITANSGTIRRPDMWEFHMERLPKERRLDDLLAPEGKTGGTAVRRFRNVVKEIRSRAEDHEGSESPEAA